MILEDKKTWKFHVFLLHMGVSKNRGGPPKWMVKIMENPIKMDDLGTPIFGNDIYGLTFEGLSYHFKQPGHDLG